MKKLAAIILILFLAACGGEKVHENISEDMVNDTNQILDIMDEAVESGNDLSDRDWDTFDSYYAKYNGKLENPDATVGGLTEEEERLFILVSNIIEHPEFYYTLESDKEDYANQKRTIQNVIETGEIYDK